ncbi:SPOR domain-containing protein [Ramlibacter alkalitolerans]|uniref:SPOR domain-containing protein n=1 Tax=Ramlibacter alkalitolerans TaxID=2039631 RepID=A0ABS1JMR1_9BURK|nr:SPOR domain-containing protein [Ramlibacter alkalitolerans]MBL0425543.1 SPOR domain-containing protein [Ramlibacter alkalitolerans]
MLRLIVLLLLLANGGYYAWSHGLLLPWGAGPLQQSEPQRLQQQIQPQAVRVLRPEELRQVQDQVAQGPRPPECLASAMLEEPQIAQLRTALQSWPAGSWNFESVTEPPRWIVYMGKYPDVELLARKRAELRQVGITFDAPGNPQLEPGLSLGSYPSEAAAQKQLEAVVAKGVRSARVVQDRPEQRGQRLLLPAVDEALRSRLDELKTPLGTRTLRPCR